VLAQAHAIAFGRAGSTASEIGEAHRRGVAAAYPSLGGIGAALFRSSGRRWHFLRRTDNRWFGTLPAPRPTRMWAATRDISCVLS